MKYATFTGLLPEFNDGIEGPTMSFWAFLIIFQGLNLYFQGHISELHTKTSLTSGCYNEKISLILHTGVQGIPNQVQTKVQPLSF